MIFSINGERLFEAPINENNAAFLAGSTVPIAEQANRSISTLPLDLTLWHRRLAHHGHKSIEAMIKHKLVTGIKLVSNASPDPICEPCLAGKMNAHPFPSSMNRASKPLDLIHTDLHGPFKTRTHSRCRYWITFIDDCTRFRSVTFLHSKDQAFDAFRKFKAYAENHFGTSIKAMRDNKGG